MYIPNEINDFIKGLPYSLDDVGMSGSKVLQFDDMVLKIEKANRHFDKMIEIMRWLEGKLPVPKVICVVKEKGLCYLLMSRIKGKMSCDEYYLERPDELCEHLSTALEMLWDVDISDCPRVTTIDDELIDARYQVENKLYDLSNAEPDTFGENGRFKNPEELLKWLEENKPTFEPCMSHGDFCLPNIFIDDCKISGFIDLGAMGVADKWRDLASCYRSLKHNFDGTFGGKVYEDFSPDLLFEKLSIEPNWEKINYYILMDELF